jgi:hypothetical protein
MSLSPRLAGLAGAAFLLMPALALIPTLAGAQTFEFKRTFPAGANVVVDVSSGRGKITVHLGEAAQVVVSGTVTVRTGLNVPITARQLAQATAENPPVTNPGKTIQVRVPTDPMVRAAVTVAYDIEVPEGATVTTVSDSGAIRIEGLTGPVSARTSSASIALVGLSGTTTVDTGSGDVTLENMAGAVAVTTKSSRITARGLEADFTARTGSGQVTAVFAGRGDADVQTQSSSVTIEGLDGGLKVTTGSGRLRVVGAPRSAWEISTGSGAVDIVLGSDASATVEATTGGGAVRVDRALLSGAIEPRHAKGTINGGGPAIRITSRSATITIAQK